MATRIVGVDIGSESLRAVEIENAESARPTVTRYHELPLPEGAVTSGEVVEVHTVATLLKQLWSAGGFQSKNVVLGVGNPRVLVRDLTVPKLGSQQIRDALPFQVQEMLPVPVADALLDFYPISEAVGEDGPVLNGLLVAAVKDSVSANVTAVRLAGLNAVDVDLIPFALVRLHAGIISGSTIAIVDVGARTTNMVIAVRGIPQFVRIIPTGGYDLTRVLAERLDISDGEAEAAKRSIGLATGETRTEDAAAVDAIQGFSSDLLDSIRNTLRYFANTRPDAPLEGVIISGGGAQLNGFSQALGELVRVPVVLADPFGGVTVSKKVKVAANDRRPAMGVALGLAMGSAA